jgi:hypothetical protein
MADPATSSSLEIRNAACLATPIGAAARSGRAQSEILRIREARSGAKTASPSSSEPKATPAACDSRPVSIDATGNSPPRFRGLPHAPGWAESRKKSARGGWGKLRL